MPQSPRFRSIEPLLPGRAARIEDGAQSMTDRLYVVRVSTKAARSRGRLPMSSEVAAMISREVLNTAMSGNSAL